MIETYKLLTNKEGISKYTFFDMNDERGDPELIRGLVFFKKRTSGRKRRKYTFSQRVVTKRGNPDLLRGEIISKQRSKKNLRTNTFSQRVVNSWNKLSKKEVQAKKTSGFKTHFDKNEVERRRVRCEKVDRDY